MPFDDLADIDVLSVAVEASKGRNWGLYELAISELAARDMRRILKKIRELSAEEYP